jgi:hypothetical protein
MAGVTLVPDPPPSEWAPLTATASEIPVGGRAPPAGGRRQRALSRLRQATSASAFPLCASGSRSALAGGSCASPPAGTPLRLRPASLSTGHRHCATPSGRGALRAAHSARRTLRGALCAAHSARRTLRLARLVALVGFLLGGSAGSQLHHHLGSRKLACRRDPRLRAVRRAVPPAPRAVALHSVDDFAVTAWLCCPSGRRSPSPGGYARIPGCAPAVAPAVATRPPARPWARRTPTRALTAFSCWPLPVRFARAVLPARTPASVKPRGAWSHRMRVTGRLSVPQQNAAAKRRVMWRDTAPPRRSCGAHSTASLPTRWPRQLGMARATVATVLRAAAVPELAPHARPRPIAPDLPALRARWDAGEHNARTRWKAVPAHGDPARVIAVRRLVASSPRRLRARASAAPRCARDPLAGQASSHLLLDAAHPVGALQPPGGPACARGRRSHCPQAARATHRRGAAMTGQLAPMAEQAARRRCSSVPAAV